MKNKKTSPPLMNSYVMRIDNDLESNKYRENVENHYD